MIRKHLFSKTKELTTGAFIEQKAQQWLQGQGLILISQNYRCREGEIDIIMLDQQQLVFVEVRYRKNDTYGNSAESVTWHKQQKLQKAAAHFLLSHPTQSKKNCRFDVVAVRPDPKHQLHWTWIKDAFVT